MLSNWREWKIVIFLTRRTTIFTCGLLLGSGVTYLATIPTFELPSLLSNDEVDLAEGAAEVGAEPARVYSPPPFNYALNARVESRIRYYLRPDRKQDLIDTYRRSGKYLPMIKAIFEEYNLPIELIYLPILESRFLPHSRSRAGAVGLWQIMPATASEFGLKYNRWIDERRDPEKSTIVAAEYLNFLYNKFENWELALAAYNGGFGKIRRAMRRDRAQSFWELKRIPRETYNFVSNYFAILNILKEPEKYDVILPKPSSPIDYETIELEATFSVEQIAKLANVSPRVIKQFNPALISDIAPSGTYAIRVPMGVKEQFLDAYKDHPKDQVEITYTTYRVRRGDTLTEIARRFGTTIRALMADNNLRSSRWIRAGMTLRIATVSVNRSTEESEDVSEVAAADSAEANKVKFIYTVERDGMALETLARYYSVTVDQIKVWNPWIQTARLLAGEEVGIFKSVEEIKIHKTRWGDSLWKIARRYNASVSDLKRWNQLTSSRIYPGSSLIVRLN